VRTTNLGFYFRRACAPAGALWSLAAVTPTRVADAQTQQPAIVRVHVAQTGGVAVAGADVILIRDGKQAIMTGRSDSAGRLIFRVDVDNTRRYSVSARMIGFAPSSFPLALVAGDTLDLDVQLARVAAELPAAHVEAVMTDHCHDATDVARSCRAISERLDGVRERSAGWPAVGTSLPRVSARTCVLAGCLAQARRGEPAAAVVPLGDG
jgi:hypothetical protein